jgi:hypothetical protein
MKHGGFSSSQAVNVYQRVNTIKLVGGLEHEFYFPNSWDDDAI